MHGCPTAKSIAFTSIYQRHPPNRGTWHRMIHRLLLALFALLILSPALRGDATTRPATLPATLPVGVFRSWPDAGEPGDALRKPGFHKLFYQWQENGKLRRFPLSVYLPQGYDTTPQQWPMLTFLAGLGDRGPDPAGSIAVGVPVVLGRDPAIANWFPMILLTPQCPSDQVWESPGMAQIIVRIIRDAAIRFAADPSRLYLTGFSNGGRGAWAVAADAPDLFAVAAPIVSREHFATATASRLAHSGISCLVVSVLDDIKSEPDSSRMVAALRKQAVDVVYAPVPRGGHFIWNAYYSQKEFYEWLLLHRRGQPIPKDRAGGDHFIGLAFARAKGPLELQQRSQKQLDSFSPYWWLDNCGNAKDCGLKPDLLGRSNVLVTRPLTLDVACRIQTTRQLPKDKWTRLTLTVGHPPAGEWELIVRVNEDEFARVLVNDQTAPGGWLQQVISLRLFAGQEVRLQLINQSTGRGNPQAYWGKIQLTQDTPR